MTMLTTRPRNRVFAEGLFDPIADAPKQTKEGHVLYTSKDCPYRDASGEHHVTTCNVCDGGLGLCKLCGRAEIELGEPCTGQRETAAPTCVICRPLPIGPTEAESDNHAGFTLGTDGEDVDLAGCSIAFLVGFWAGRDKFDRDVRSGARPRPAGYPIDQTMVDYQSGHAQGLAGLNIDLAGRSGAFVTGYLGGQDEAARKAMANGLTTDRGFEDVTSRFD